MVRVHGLDRLRLLDRDQTLECRDGPKDRKYHLLLVQVQLREPPERVVAKEEASANGLAVYQRQPQPLDPRVRSDDRLFFSRAVQVIADPNSLRAACLLDEEP